MTYAEKIPPLGIPQKIKVSHVDQSTFVAETCLYELEVPIACESLEDFGGTFQQACVHNEDCRDCLMS